MIVNLMEKSQVIKKKVLALLDEEQGKLLDEVKKKTIGKTIKIHDPEVVERAGEGSTGKVTNVKIAPGGIFLFFLEHESGRDSAEIVHQYEVIS